MTDSNERALFLLDAAATFTIMQEIVNERVRQDVKWGQQNHIDGTGPQVRPLNAMGRVIGPLPAHALADYARKACQSNGTPQHPDTWTAILLEEVFEALAEDDPAKLRAELVQVAAVAAGWAEAIVRRTA
jgi:hypothetical protein